MAEKKDWVKIIGPPCPQPNATQVPGPTDEEFELWRNEKLGSLPIVLETDPEELLEAASPIHRII